MNALDLILADNNILQYRTGLEDEDGILITAFSLASTRNCRKKKFKLEFYGRPAFAFFLDLGTHHHVQISSCHHQKFQ